MITISKKFLLPIFSLFDENEYFGTLKGSYYLFPRAKFAAKEGKYNFYRENWWGGKYYCSFYQNQKAVAEKPNGIGYSYLIHFNSKTFFLKPGEHFFEKTHYHFNLLHNDQIIGCLVGYRRQYILKIEEGFDLPNIIQCFIFWLGLLSCFGHLRGTSGSGIHGVKP